MIGLGVASLQLPPWPYDSILDGQPLMLRPQQDGLLVGHRLGELEENPQQLDNLGSRGIPFAYVITAKAVDRVVKRDDTIDTLNTAGTIRAALRAIAARRGTVTWVDPDGKSLAVSVRDPQERRLSMEAPGWDITLTLVLRDPVNA